MDRIPPIKAQMAPAVEQAARMKDLQDRARAAKPVDTGRDVLLGYDSDGRQMTTRVDRY